MSLEEHEDPFQEIFSLEKLSQARLFFSIANSLTMLSVRPLFSARRGLPTRITIPPSFDNGYHRHRKRASTTASYVLRFAVLRAFRGHKMR